MPRADVSTDTTCIHGLRTILNVSVVILHTFVILTVSLDHPKDARALLTGSFSAQVLSTIATFGSVSVDDFLVISGFLLKAAFSSKQPTLSTSIRYTMFRYLRLAPPYLVLSLMINQLGKPQCMSLPELLLVSLAHPNDLCISVGWSTNVDFLSHIVLLPLLSHPSILTGIIVLTPPLRMLTWLQRGKPSLLGPSTIVDHVPSEEYIDVLSEGFGLPRGNFNLSDPTIIARRNIMDMYYPLHFGLPLRLAYVAVGILLYTYMQKKNGVYRTVRAFPTASLALTSGLWMLFPKVKPNYFGTQWGALLDHSASGLLLTLATSVMIILTCTIDDYPLDHWISRFLRRLLSWRAFTVLQKFSYVVYLSHMMTGPVLGMIPPRFTKERLVAGWIIALGLEWYMCTILITLPVWGLERIALAGRRLVLRRICGARKATDGDTDGHKKTC